VSQEKKKKKKKKSAADSSKGGFQGDYFQSIKCSLNANFLKNNAFLM